MNNERLEKLMHFLREDPEDCFTLYAIALEYSRTSVKDALPYFEKLLDLHPSYLPTYYMACEAFKASGMENRAKDTYEKGIKLAKEQNEPKTLNELQGAYNNFLLELEGLL